MTRRALVLSGGGARGAFQVGMLQELVANRGIDFQVLRGVSVGALNAAFLAQTPTADDDDSPAALRRSVAELTRIWTDEIEGNHSVYRSRPGGWLGLIGGANSIYELDPLDRLLRKHLSLDALRTSGRDFAVGTVSLVTGRYEEWTPADERFLDLVLASSSIPVVFPDVKIPEKQDVFVDGGVRDISPLGSAFATRPDEIYVLLASRLVREGEDLPRSSVPEHTYERWDDDRAGTEICALDILTRSVEILTDEVYLGDIRTAVKWNRICNAAANLDAKLEGLGADAAAALAGLHEALADVDRRRVDLHVLAPRVWYGENNAATDFDPAHIAEAIEHGRAVARDESLWLWPPVPAV